MTRRNPVIDELHALRERLGRAHGFDAKRIAATIRKHERERQAVAQRAVRAVRPVTPRGSRAAQQAAAADKRRVKSVTARG